MGTLRCPDAGRFTEEERTIIAACDTPEKAQALLDTIPYNFERDGIPTIRSFRRVMREGVAHCLEGALTVATILRHHGYPPWLLCMEARDIDHIIFPYRRGRMFGAVGQSRDPDLKGRPPEFRTVGELVESYRPFYWNSLTGDRNDITLRGYCLTDLRSLPDDWMTSEVDVTPVEDLLYSEEYSALPPYMNGFKRFMSNRDGSITWIAHDEHRAPSAVTPEAAAPRRRP